MKLAKHKKMECLENKQNLQSKLLFRNSFPEVFEVEKVVSSNFFYKPTVYKVNGRC